MKIRLIIFDLDGTLVHTLEDITTGVNKALDLPDSNSISSFEVSKMIGRGPDKLIDSAMAEASLYTNLPHTREEYLKRYLEYCKSNPVIESKEYKGTREVLEELSDVKKSVVTNKTENLAIRVLKRLDLDRYFETIIGCDSTDTRKPSVVPYLRAMTNADVKPSETLVVGDSRNDVLPCKRIPGVRSVACIYGYGEPGFQWDADYIIDDIKKLPRIVKEIE